MQNETELFEVLVVNQGFEYRISNFTMADFRRDELPNFKEPDNISYRRYYRIEKHRLRSQCPWGYSRWITGENGKLKRLDYNYDTVVGKKLYLKQVQKIVPTMRYEDLRYAHGIGGLRPQIVNLKTREIVFGVSQIFGENGDPSIFNITPSPGATAALQTGMLNIQRAVAITGETFDQEKFNRELRQPIYQKTTP